MGPIKCGSRGRTDWVCVKWMLTTSALYIFWQPSHRSNRKSKNSHTFQFVSLPPFLPPPLSNAHYWTYLSELWELSNTLHNLPILWNRRLVSAYVHIMLLHMTLSDQYWHYWSIDRSQSWEMMEIFFFFWYKVAIFATNLLYKQIIRILGNQFLQNTP